MNLKTKKISLTIIIMISLVALGVGIADKFTYLRALPNDTSPLDEYSQGSTNSDKVFVPNFTLTNEMGINVNFEDLNEKPVIISFWAASNENEAEELKKYQDLILEYSSQFTFIFLNCTASEGESMDGALEFLEENDLSFITPYFDLTGEAEYLFGIQEFPTTAFINKDGYLISGVIGDTTYETVKIHIENLKNN